MTAQITVNNTGIKVPQADEIKTELQGVFSDAFGTDLSLDDSTPQGVLIDSLTQQKELDNAQLLYFLNQLNPKTADGIFQDALASIYFIKRNEPTNSVVNCVCTGAVGTVLNGVGSGNPAMAQSANGDLFQCLSGGTIPASGSITLAFSAVETGPIPVASNTVNKIYSVVSGWDTINNPTSGVLGEELESRANFAERIKKSLALNSTGSVSSVYSHIFDVKGVTDLFIWENTTDSNVTYRGITLSPHSIYICQNGAQLINSSDGDGSLAEAIFNSKSAGCDTTKVTAGYSSCTYTDPLTGIVYTYNYYIPTDTNIYIKITLSDSISADVEQQIKDVLLAEFRGQGKSGSSKITIGSTIYASRFYKDVLSILDSDTILENIKISTDGTTWSDTLNFNINILPVLDIESTSPSYVQIEVES